MEQNLGIKETLPWSTALSILSSLIPHLGSHFSILPYSLKSKEFLLKKMLLIFSLLENKIYTLWKSFKVKKIKRRK